MPILFSSIGTTKRNYGLVDRLGSLFFTSFFFLRGGGGVSATNQQLQLVVYNNKMKRNTTKVTALSTNVYWTNKVAFQMICLYPVATNSKRQHCIEMKISTVLNFV